MKHIALFAGMGGFIYAAENNGIQTVWANEINSKCVDVLNLNFPKTQISNKSISDLNENDLVEVSEHIDLLTAGFPCQSFSQAAGEFKGFDDPRGKLFFDIPRVIGLMRAPPKVVLLENVPNLMKFDKGALLRTVLSEMRFAGYWVKAHHAQIINSSEFGRTPQRRERLFIVCVHKSYHRYNPFDFSGLKRVPRPKLFHFINRLKIPDEHYYLPKDSKYFEMIDNLAEVTDRNRLFQIRKVTARACEPNVCPTLTANMGVGGHNVPFVFDKVGLRRLTENECLKLQGFDPKKLKIPPSVAAKHILEMTGNAVSVTTASAIIEAIKQQIFDKSGSGLSDGKDMAVSA